ncbi:L,D-transpeptidase family protein, partial [Candidatus Pelagibacter bacterium]|nr:L,D-transpeptidase family protein [Candidatus Pelagibacter bacterium]
CSIGKNGISTKKIEGDKKTPKGLYSLGPLYFRNNRVSEPKTLLKSIPIRKNMGWCDDVKSKFYNKIINTKKKLRHEKLFIKKNDYDLLIPINYNTKKTKKGKGSAIFLHLTKNYNKTLGCIAIKKKDMIILLKIITQKTKIEIT